MIQYLFNHWQDIRRRLQSAPTIALFLDFDGTLAPLQARPEQVLLPGAVRQELRALANSRRFRVWVISGRRQSDVRAKVGIPGIRYLGLHGWEGRGGPVVDQTRRCLAALSERLTAELGAVPGLWIEDKEYAFAVHHRAADALDLSAARAGLEAITAPCGERFRIAEGEKVWEILPREMEDKGAAVKQQLALLKGRYHAVYVGDDQVDEPAFAALRDEITVRVGSRGPSQALYRLAGVADVRKFLRTLRTELL